MSDNKRRAEFLGIPPGTAFARLKKQILFSLLKKYKENFCFRCQNEITNVSELTIDHKEPWEGIDVELFWDLDNISFSHSRCNRPHRKRGGGSKKKLFPLEGTAWCASHKTFLPRSAFDKGGRADGLRDYCKECRSSRRKKGLGR